MKKIVSVVLSLAFVMSLTIPSFAQFKKVTDTHFTTKPTYEDVVVGKVSTSLAGKGTSRDLKMNIYQPKDAKNPTPVVIYIHGGAWNSGDYTCKNLMDKDTGTNDPFFACMRTLNMGCTVVTADYRLSTEELFPAMVWDLKGQIRYLRANAKKYNIDPDRIIVWGQSAGAHLANLLGTTDGVKELEGDVGGNLKFSSKPTAVVDYYGMTDILQLAPDQYERPHIIDPMEMYKQADAPDSSRAQLLGFTGEDEGLDVLRANLGNPGSPYENPDSPYQDALHRAYLSCPLNFLDKNDCPVMILHGGLDNRVAPQQSYNFFEMLTKYSVEAYMFANSASTHGNQGEFAAQAALRFVSDQFGLKKK